MSVVSGNHYQRKQHTQQKGKQSALNVAKLETKPTSYCSDHLEECPNLNIDYPDKSSIVRPKRKSIEAHHQKCSKEIISCEYAGLGCNHVFLREGLLCHSKQQVHTHLQLASYEC